MTQPGVSPECETVQLELNAYVDGELSSASHAAIARHLESCAACRAELALLQLVTQSLRLVPRPEPSEAMRRQLLAQVIAELPLHRTEILCTERHGDQVTQRREVRLSRESPLPPGRAPAAAPPHSAISQRYRQASAYHSNAYRVIESHYEEGRP